MEFWATGTQPIAVALTNGNHDATDAIAPALRHRNVIAAAKKNTVTETENGFDVACDSNFDSFLRKP